MLLDIGDDDTVYLPSVHLEVPPPYIVISYFFVNFSQVCIYLFVVVKTECLNHHIHFRIAFVGKSVSVDIASTNIVNLEAPVT